MVYLVVSEDFFFWKKDTLSYLYVIFRATYETSYSSTLQKENHRPRFEMGMSYARGVQQYNEGLPPKMGGHFLMGLISA